MLNDLEWIIKTAAFVLEKICVLKFMYDELTVGIVFRPLPKIVQSMIVASFVGQVCSTAYMDGWVFGLFGQGNHPIQT